MSKEIGLRYNDCQVCKTPLVLDKKWKPQSGLDPQLRRWDCPGKPKHTVYLAYHKHYPKASDYNEAYQAQLAGNRRRRKTFGGGD